MPSHGRIPHWIGLLLLLGLAVLSNGACTSKFFSLPAATYGSHVYMLELNSADTFCKSQRFSKAGSVRKTNLDIMGLPVRKNNFGDYNDGDNNIGSYNEGNNNWGSVSPSPQEDVSLSPQQDVSLSPQQDVSLSPSKEHVSSSTTISEITSSTFPPLSSPLSASTLSSPLSAFALSSPLSASALAFSPLPSAVSSSPLSSAVSSSPLPAALSPPTPVPTLPTASSANTDPGYRQNCVLHYQVHHHLDIQLPNGVGVC
ncbi:hypothetical protein ACKKBF_B41005 [Auxenochlorella protothecoides x Auxenochlorella symbiontica]